MRTFNENLEKERPRTTRNVALGIYVIVTTAFASAYTLVTFLNF